MPKIEKKLTKTENAFHLLEGVSINHQNELYGVDSIYKINTYMISYNRSLIAPGEYGGI